MNPLGPMVLSVDKENATTFTSSKENGWDGVIFQFKHFREENFNFFTNFNVTFIGSTIRVGNIQNSIYSSPSQSSDMEKICILVTLLDLFLPRFFLLVDFLVAKSFMKVHNNTSLIFQQLCTMIRNIHLSMRNFQVRGNTFNFARNITKDIFVPQLQFFSKILELLHHNEHGSVINMPIPNLVNQRLKGRVSYPHICLKEKYLSAFGASSKHVINKQQTMVREESFKTVHFKITTQSHPFQITQTSINMGAGKCTTLPFISPSEHFFSLKPISNNSQSLTHCKNSQDEACHH